MRPSDILDREELLWLKRQCVKVNARSVKIEGVKYVNLPLEKWREELNDFEPST